MFDRRDLEEALVQWSGQSRFLPTAAELAPIASRLRNSRLARASEEKLLAVWRCPRCNVTRSGFVEASDLGTRYCRNYATGGMRGQRCGGPMNEILRTPYSTKDELEAA
ncbi:MAG: hypothetical protein ACLGSD_13865 [Acidobacteriota bacterium]